MVVFDIDKDTSKALKEWRDRNITEPLPCFYNKVLMNIGPDPLPISTKITKEKNGIVSFKVPNAEQMSFYEDTKLERSTHQFSSALGNPLMRDEFIDAYLSAQLDYMKGKPQFKIRTTVSFAFKHKAQGTGGKIKITELPLLEDWYGFDPRENYDMQMTVLRRLMGDRFREEPYEDSLKEQHENMKQVFTMQANKVAAVYWAANDFLYMANKDKHSDRIIRAAASRDDNGNKVIAFRLLKAENTGGGEIYAVEVPEDFVSKDEKGIVSVRGHLRRLEADRYKKKKVIWVDAFLRGMPEEYYKEKRKTKRNTVKPDASFEDPACWETDILENTHERNH